MALRNIKLSHRKFRAIEHRQSTKIGNAREKLHKF